MGVRAGLAGLILAWSALSASASPKPLTLDRALAEARAANAKLPLSAADAAIARMHQRTVHAALLPSFSLQGDLHYGRPPDYSDEEAQIHVMGTVPLYHGGALRADERAAAADTQAASARYRMAEKDLELSVRTGYFQILSLDEEIAAHSDGLSRLREYLGSIRARAAAGQDVSTDLLETKARLGQEQAAHLDAKRRRDVARVAFNDLLGRVPEAPLTVAQLPAPSAPGAAPGGAPWQSAPELAEAEAQRKSARADVDSASAARWPRVDLGAEAGAIEPFFGASTLGPTASGEGYGYSLTLDFSWSFWSFGKWQDQIREARLRAERAEKSEKATRRQVRLAWTKAQVQLGTLYQRIGLLAQTRSTARDAYLSAESRYRGGVGSTLEVLNAFTAWIDSRVAENQAVLDYRTARAERARWGSR